MTDNPQATCQRAIHKHDVITGKYSEKCGRKATHIQPGNLPVCEHHYNKYFKRIAERSKK